MTHDANPLFKLELPRRWEMLTERAGKVGKCPLDIIEPVDDAAKRVELLLRRLRGGAGGSIEVFYGLSGSGKTTFLQSLPKFFNNIRVHFFSKDVPLLNLTEFIGSTHNPTITDSRIIVVERRDNPSQPDMSRIDKLMADLLEKFREADGHVLVLWPITRHSDAVAIAGKAWDTGRDSMVDVTSRGLYVFKGVSKEKYYTIADCTTQSFTGDKLDVFGITHDVGASLLPRCETISDFFALVDSKADESRSATWAILKERSRAHVWIVLPGDDAERISATASALTQGTINRIDIDLIREFIDRADNDAVYVRDWRDRRASLAHFLRIIDVRLFPLPPNVAVHAVRLFGDATLKANLKVKSSTNSTQAKDTLKSTRLYKAILSELGIQTPPFAGSRDVGDDTVNEYRRIQKTAAVTDKPLNKALGHLMGACLADDAPAIRVSTETRNIPGCSLQPDIQLQLSDRHFICIEPTWRTSGAGIQAEIEPGQNTLTEGHIKKYVMDKALQYIKDLRL